MDRGILTPTFDCTYTRMTNKTSDTYPGRITLDSGACLSVIHESLLEQCDYEYTGNRSKEYSGAGGDRLPLLDEVADVKVHVEEVGWIIFRNVLVLKKSAKFTSTMLIGRYDLQRLQVSMNFEKGTVRFGIGPKDGILFS